MHLNLCSLRNKLDFIRILLLKLSIDIVVELSFTLVMVQRRNGEVIWNQMNWDKYVSNLSKIDALPSFCLVCTSTKYQRCFFRRSYAVSLTHFC